MSSGSSRAGSPRGPVPGTCFQSCPRSPTSPRTPSTKVFVLPERPMRAAQREAVRGGLGHSTLSGAAACFLERPTSALAARICGFTYFPPVIPAPPTPPTHRPDQPAQQAAGGLAPLRQRPARGGTHFRRLLLHTQSPAGEPGDSHPSCPWAAPGHVGRPCPQGPFSSSRLSTRLGSRMIPLCLHLGEGVLGLAGSRPPSPGRRVPNALASITYLPGPRPLGR